MLSAEYRWIGFLLAFLVWLSWATAYFYFTLGRGHPSKSRRWKLYLAGFVGGVAMVATLLWGPLTGLVALAVAAVFASYARGTIVFCTVCHAATVQRPYFLVHEACAQCGREFSGATAGANPGSDGKDQPASGAT